MYVCERCGFKTAKGGKMENHYRNTGHNKEIRLYTYVSAGKGQQKKVRVK